MSQNKALTLIDLLIGIVIFSLIVLSVSALNLFSQKELRISERNSWCQKEVSYVVEYIIKEIHRGIGDFAQPAVGNTTIDSNPGITIRTDSNRNGKIDLMPPDQQSAFVYDAERHRIFFYPDASSQEKVVVSKNIFMPNFAPVIKDNYVTVEISVCWDPGKTKTHADCGAQINPLVTMRSRISMPSVATH